MEENAKVLLILVDGMRPDSIAACQNSYAAGMLEKNHFCTMDAKTVFPSVTLPCHMSLFHSVTPQRHGILTNTYVPVARTVNGLAEVLHAAGKKCAFYYTWEELRDLARPGTLAESVFATMYGKDIKNPEAAVTKAAVAAMKEEAPDFMFLYLGVSDETGHRYGWMSREYLEAISSAWDRISEIVTQAPEEYRILITADHGGHDCGHGSDDPQDMTIPVIITGGKADIFRDGEVSILDIAPTIADWLQTPADDAWTGRSLVVKKNKKGKKNEERVLI